MQLGTLPRIPHGYISRVPSTEPNRNWLRPISTIATKETLRSATEGWLILADLMERLPASVSGSPSLDRPEQVFLCGSALAKFLPAIRA
jgi:hypothetical protein